MRRALLAGIPPRWRSGDPATAAAPRRRTRGRSCYMVPGGRHRPSGGDHPRSGQERVVHRVRLEQFGRIMMNSTVDVGPAGVCSAAEIMAGPARKMWFCLAAASTSRMACNSGGVTNFTARASSARRHHRQPRRRRCRSPARTRPDQAHHDGRSHHGVPRSGGLDQNDLIAHIVTGPDGDLWLAPPRTQQDLGAQVTPEGACVPRRRHRGRCRRSPAAGLDGTRRRQH